VIRVPQHSSTYFPYFDWLRFALALVVMLGHADYISWHSAANLAVHVFFVLSGWLIGAILLETTPSELPRFFFNRALRIWVPYFIATALLLALSVLRDPIGAEWVQLVVLKLLMVYNLFSGYEVMANFPHAPLDGTAHHLWSVNAEEQFYVVAPLLLVVVARWGRSPLTWFVIAAAFLAIGTDYPGLALGVLAAIVLKDRDWHRTRMGVAACLTLGLIAIPFMASEATYMRAAPFFGLSVVLLLARPGLATRIGTVAGGLSYPLYLNHWIGIYAGNAAVSRLGLPSSLRLAIVVVVGVGFALAHYYLVDRTIRNHRAQWYSPGAGYIAMSSAYVALALGLAFGFATVGRIV
jgi:peptidoglycan/LPS O-acetylase OafA/YrhL